MKDTVIAIPTYNEALTLPRQVEKLRRAVPQADLVIIDDNSPDGTGRLAEELAAVDPGIKVIHRTEKAGLGPAYLEAFSWANSAGYTWVVQMDADGSHRARDLKKLLARRSWPNQPDLVIGSRWVRGGRLQGWSKLREALSRAGNAYIGALLRLGIRDATAGFRVYRLDFLNRLRLEDLDSRGYCFQIDMTRRAVKAGGNLVEVPITFQERAAGASKMSSAIILEALAKVTRWGLSDWCKKLTAK